jgi:hypothetical protein
VSSGWRHFALFFFFFFATGRDFCHLICQKRRRKVICTDVSEILLEESYSLLTKTVNINEKLTFSSETQKPTVKTTNGEFQTMRCQNKVERKMQDQGEFLF